MLRYIDAVRVLHGTGSANCGLTQQQYCCLANTLALSFFVTGILARFPFVTLPPVVCYVPFCQ